jgi:hypothetical protein
VARSCERAAAGSPGRRQLYAQAEASVHALYQAGGSVNTARWRGFAFATAPILLPVPVVLQFVVDHVERIEGSTRAHDLPPAIDVALVQAGLKDHGGRPESRPGRFSEGFARRWSPKPWSRKPFGPS